ncbi:MAG: response regulator, partial [Pedobacter sp.]
NQKTPILMMSAHSTLKDLQEYCEANSFLQKPFDINELISQVNSLTEN